MFLTFAEACDHIRVSPETLRKLLKSGEIKAHKNGTGGRTSHYRIDRASLDAYIEQRSARAVKAS
jgi:excisionase family DNA binding protein